MTTALAPFTMIDNGIILNMADMGVYCYAVYSAIKMHLNHVTGACFPSYATIARITGMNRSTVIECVKKLKAMKLILPEWRFKEDGSHNSNQYHFEASGKKRTSKPQRTENSASSKKVVGQDNQGSRPHPPEPKKENKRIKTIEEIVTTEPTEKQQTCPHPPELIVILPDNITICHHCYGLLDENLKLKEEDKPLTERVYAA